MGIVIRAEHLSKSYRLGQIGTGTLANDLKVWWSRVRGLPNPVHRIGDRLPSGNDRGRIWALRDVNFTVQEGDVLGIIGRNGAGKSTLLKVLSRVTAPTEGSIKVKGRIASLLEVGTGFHPELSGRENVYLNGAILGMDRAEIRRKFDEIVDFAEVERFIDTPVKRYSSGMYVRLAFAIAAHLSTEILIVDEVLAVGDAQFQKKCLGKMGDAAQDGRTVLFVSHDMGAIERLCTRGAYVDNGQFVETETVTEAIHAYIGSSARNLRVYENKPLVSVGVEQVNASLQIDVTYRNETELMIPSFGFNIADSGGRWICGTNPKIDRIDRQWRLHKSGKIRVIVNQPKLLDGNYRLAVWFGDGHKDFFNDENCLEFQVLNMTQAQQSPANIVGPVYPQCDWSFYEDL